MLRCDHPLPDPEFQNAEFHAVGHALEFEEYRITREGRLRWYPANGPEGEDMEFHGELLFEACTDAGTVGFLAHFVRGTVRKITRIAEDAPAPTPTPLEALAEAVDADARQRLFNHRRFLRRLVELDPEVVSRTLELWESRSAAADWLVTPHPELGDVTPYRMLARGRRKAVLELLGRLFYGFCA